MEIGSGYQASLGERTIIWDEMGCVCEGDEGEWCQWCEIRLHTWVRVPTKVGA